MSPDTMPFSTATSVALAGLIIGLIFGFTAHRANFCTMGAISDLVAMGDGRRFRSWMLAIAVALGGSQLMHAAGLIDLGQSIYLAPRLNWFGAISGGLAFGFGMTLAGGCGSRTLIRLGAGNLKSLLVILVLAVTGYMTLRGLIQPARGFVEGLTTIDLAKRGLGNQGLGEFVRAATGFNATPWLALVATLALLAYSLGNAAFRNSPADVVAGIVLGLMVPASWAATGILGNDEFEPVALASITFVAPTSEGLVYLMTFTGSTINFGIASVGGVVLGAAISALLNGEWKLEAFNGTTDMLNHVVGGALMGIGGVTALGCTIGQGLSGITTLAAGSILALAGILVGGVWGVKYLEEGSLADALRSMLSRS